MLDPLFLPFPVLVTDRLVLRQATPHDAAALHRLRSDERVMQHIGRPRATSVEDAAKLIASIAKDQQEGNAISWVITLKGANELIGTIGYYRLKKEHFRGEVGYILAPEQWGKGIMSEALEAVVVHAFAAFGFHSVEAITDPNNTASNRLLQRNGFTREGLFKENFFWNGHFYDSAVWSRLAPYPDQ